MKETWNQAEISEDIKPVNYVSADSWNAAELNEAINLFGIKYPVDTWNPAEFDEKARNIINDITSTKTVTGNPISFKTINGGYAKSCEVAFTPIQSGSGDPSPDNVRPISGWDSLVLNQTGANQWDEQWELGGLDSVGQLVPATNRIRSKNYIRLFSGESYYVKTALASTDLRIAFYDAEKAFISNSSWMISGIITAPSNALYAKFVVANLSTYGNNISINYPSTDTEYHAYQGTTHTATFPSTIYGGSLDMVSGKLTSEWGYIESYDGETITEPWISSIDVYSPNTSPSTGAEVCYKLATPQEITLSAEQIELLKGNNVLRTDGDSVTLKYTKLALPEDSDGLSLNQKVKKAIEIIKGKEIKEETKKSTTKGRRKKS